MRQMVSILALGGTVSVAPTCKCPSSACHAATDSSCRHDCRHRNILMPNASTICPTLPSSLTHPSQCESNHVFVHLARQNLIWSRKLFIDRALCWWFCRYWMNSLFLMDGLGGLLFDRVTSPYSPQSVNSPGPERLHKHNWSHPRFL